MDYEQKGVLMSGDNLNDPKHDYGEDVIFIPRVPGRNDELVADNGISPIEGPGYD